MSAAEKGLQCVRVVKSDNKNQKGSVISLEKVISISKLWTFKQQQVEAHSVQSLHYEHLFKIYSIPVSVYFSYQRCCEISAFIWVI